MARRQRARRRRRSRRRGPRRRRPAGLVRRGQVRARDARGRAAGARSAGDMAVVPSGSAWAPPIRACACSRPHTRCPDELLGLRAAEAALRSGRVHERRRAALLNLGRDVVAPVRAHSGPVARAKARGGPRMMLEADAPIAEVNVVRRVARQGGRPRARAGAPRTAHADRERRARGRPRGRRFGPERVRPHEPSRTPRALALAWGSSDDLQ